MGVTGDLRTTRSAWWVLLLVCCPLAAHAQASSGTEPASRADETELPARRLVITVIAGDALIGTLQQRVSSWFSDGTLVAVSARSELDSQRLLAAAPGEVSACVVPLSPERAVVIFASDSTRPSARYLVREVRLRSGLDDLGLERLASVIHSAFVALREGAEGFERAHVERELREMGLAPVPAGATTAASTAAPLPLPISAASAPAPIVPAADDSSAPSSAAARAALLLAVGYGARLRGAEGLGHGPSVGAGLELPGAAWPIELWACAQFLVPSRFEAGSFDTSLQTTALRLRAGVAPPLGASYRLQALVGAGADVARIHPLGVDVGADGNGNGDEGAPQPRDAGTQWRGAGELTFGLVRAGQALELAFAAHVMFLFSDVHYSVVTDQGERRLSAPWSVQPSLSVSGRFRSTL
jgi:hypothetical protein